MEAEAKPDLRSAYEKSGADDLDPRCIPQRLDHEPPVGSDAVYPSYPPLDHRNWRHLFDRQMAILPGRAGDVFFKGVEILGMTPDRIPSLGEMSARMEAATGWRIARIPGLLHEKDFFNLLSQRLFPSTDYIRGTHELDYTPAPDCFHDMFGHMPMLTHPAFADFYHLFGQAALRAEGEDRISLERLHWFTVEFGLIRQADGDRIFGAGILSSKNEAAHALSDAVEVRPFDSGAFTAQYYDVWHLQPILYALDSFDQLVAEFRKWTQEKKLI